MAFFEHLGELRRRLTIVFSVIVLLTVSFYFQAADWFLNFVLGPIKVYLPALAKFGGNFIVTDALEAMTIRLTAAFYLALIVGSPVIIWQAFAFFLPALKPKERKYVWPTSVAAAFLFILGVVFCYTIIYKPGFQWLITQAPRGAITFPRMGDFFQIATMLHFAFGIGFLLPIVVFYLIMFQIVPYKTLRAQWRFVYVGICIVSAVVTPDWSPFTMGGLSIALIILYELTMVLARVVLAKRIAAQQAAALAD
jgi:sec-independent protein translocase protein TatC